MFIARALILCATGSWRSAFQINPLGHHKILSLKPHSFRARNLTVFTSMALGTDSTCQWNPGWTHIRANSTCYAVFDIQASGFLHVPFVYCIENQYGMQTNWTGANASWTFYAGCSSFERFILAFGKNNYAWCSLSHRRFCCWQRGSHHDPAYYNLLYIALINFKVIEDIAYRSSYFYEQVFRLFYVTR